MLRQSAKSPILSIRAAAASTLSVARWSASRDCTFSCTELEPALLHVASLVCNAAHSQVLLPAVLLGYRGMLRLFSEHAFMSAICRQIWQACCLICSAGASRWQLRTNLFNDAGAAGSTACWEGLQQMLTACKGRRDHKAGQTEVARFEGMRLT